MSAARRPAPVHLPRVERRNTANRPEVVKTEEPTASPEALLAQQVAQMEAAADEKASAFLNALTEIDTTYRRECALLIVQFIEAIAPRLCKAAAMTEIANLLQEEIYAERGKITLRAHPRLASDLVQLFQSESRTTAKIDIAPDGTLSAHAIDVVWRDGGLVHDPDRLIAEFLTLLDRSIQGLGATNARKEKTNDDPHEDQ